MTISISDILSIYGFKTHTNGSKFWGIGSLVWGYTAEVKNLGQDLYEVQYHKWAYDCDGECVKDERSTAVLYGARLLQFLFERLPLRSV